MATTSKPLVTVDDVKCLLPIRDGNVSFDERIRTLIITATAQIEQATKRFFERQVHVQHFAARNTSRTLIDLIGDDRSTVRGFDDYHTSGTRGETNIQTLTLQSFPVDIAQTVEVIYDPQGRFANNSSFIVVDDDNYEVDEDKGLIYLRFGMRRGRRRIQVTFTGGFVAAGDTGFETLSEDLTTQGFDDIKQAAIIQTVFLFKKLDRENVGKKQDQKQGGQPLPFRKMGGLCPEAGSLLTAYKAILKGSG
jgi:hypothetical protein